MTSRFPPGALLLLAACGGGGSLYTTLTASPAAGPPDVFECVRAQIPKLRYQQTSIDLDAWRISAKRNDDSQSRADARFHRLVNKLEAEVRAGADGKTSLTVVARTFAEAETVRGPTLTEEAASEGVRAAAAAIQQACGS